MTRSLFALVTSFAFSATAAFAGGHSQSVVYKSGDKEFSAYAMTAGSAPKGTVYIIHDWNGLDSSVSVVPGWRSVTVALGQRLAHSMLRQRSN